MKQFHFSILILSALSLFPETVFAGVSLKGAASSLSAPLYLSLAGDFQRSRQDLKLKIEVKNPSDAVNQFLGRGAEFAAVDTPLTDLEEKKSFGRQVLHLPAAIEGVVVTYNLPGVPNGIKLTLPVLSKIFMGTIKRWNDTAITELNPGTQFPPMDILVIHREDQSSLRDLFPSALARLDPQWTAKREKEKNLKWPVGRSVKGDGKVVEKLRRWPGVIAAVDFSFAAENKLPTAQLRNTAGHFVAPSPRSLLAATEDWVNLSGDFRIVLGRSRSPEAYPLCTFSWLLVYEDEFKATHDHPKARAMFDFIQWIFNDGQKNLAGLSFVPLPDSFLAQVREKIKDIKY